MTEKAAPGGGDVEIDLDGEKHVLRCNYKAYSQINREIPGGIFEAIRVVGSGDINAIESVIAAGVGFTDIGRRNLGDKIFKTGTRNLNLPLQTYLLNLANGGRPFENKDGSEEPDPPQS